jgi:hypothetical protein
MNNQNPFQSILDSFQGAQQQSSAPEQPSQMSEQQEPQSALVQAQAAAQTPDMQKSDLQPGQITGGSPYLVNAIQDLHNAIKDAQDPDTIRTIRAIILILGQMVSADQEAQMGQLS